jgi:endonuclease/exonuclease/phosphatase family metal-dependent hydrolase
MPLLFVSALLAVALQPTWLQAQTLRIATFNTELSRKGPGLLLRDIERDNDAQIQAVVAVISQNQPDILVLQGIDWDHGAQALRALEQRLAAAGSPFPHLFSRQPNTGLATGLDLDGDQRLGGPGDSQGYGDYTGRSGMAVLSRYPILADDVSDLSGLLWRDVPGATLPRHQDGSPFPSPQAQAVQRLSTTAHWALPVAANKDTRLTLLVFKATTPLFDGVEDRNGLRNADEIRLWQAFLSGQLPPEIGLPPTRRFLIAGGANLDPKKGAGRREVIAGLLQDPRLKDPQPRSSQSGTDTVDWGKDRRMRVDYLLPSRDLQVVASGVDWPDSPEDAAAQASRHRLVWVDIALD